MTSLRGARFGRLAELTARPVVFPRNLSRRAFFCLFSCFFCSPFCSPSAPSGTPAPFSSTVTDFFRSLGDRCRSRHTLPCGAVRRIATDRSNVQRRVDRVASGAGSDGCRVTPSAPHAPRTRRGPGLARRKKRELLAAGESGKLRAARERPATSASRKRTPMLDNRALRCLLSPDASLLRRLCAEGTRGQVLRDARGAARTEPRASESETARALEGRDGSGDPRGQRTLQRR